MMLGEQCEICGYENRTRHYRRRCLLRDRAFRIYRAYFRLR